MQLEGLSLSYAESCEAIPPLTLTSSPGCLHRLASPPEMVEMGPMTLLMVEVDAVNRLDKATRLGNGREEVKARQFSLSVSA